MGGGPLGAGPQRFRYAALVASSDVVHGSIERGADRRRALGRSACLRGPDLVVVRRVAAARAAPLRGRRQAAARACVSRYLFIAVPCRGVAARPGGWAVRAVERVGRCRPDRRRSGDRSAPIVHRARRRAGGLGGRDRCGRTVVGRRCRVACMVAAAGGAPPRGAPPPPPKLTPAGLGGGGRRAPLPPNRPPERQISRLCPREPPPPPPAAGV